MWVYFDNKQDEYECFEPFYVECKDDETMTAIGTNLEGESHLLNLRCKSLHELSNSKEAKKRKRKYIFMLSPIALLSLILSLIIIFAIYSLTLIFKITINSIAIPFGMIGIAYLIFYSQLHRYKPLFEEIETEKEMIERIKEKTNHVK